MYTLYWAKDSGALAPQILLQECAAEYRREILDLDAGDQRQPEFLAINPRGQVPALVLEDGSILTESAAMMLQIADSFAQAGLLPPAASSQRACVYRWLFFAVANIYEADLRIYYSDSYSAREDCAGPIRDQARLDMDAAWDLIEDQIGEGPFLLGSRYSLIDPYLLMLAQWHEDKSALFTRCPRLQRLCDAVKARPACQAIWQQHYSDS